MLHQILFAFFLRFYTIHISLIINVIRGIYDEFYAFLQYNAIFALYLHAKKIFHEKTLKKVKDLIT
jgi:hypothetical protein